MWLAHEQEPEEPDVGHLDAALQQLLPRHPEGPVPVVCAVHQVRAAHGGMKVVLLQPTFGG